MGTLGVGGIILPNTLNAKSVFSSTGTEVSSYHDEIARSSDLGQRQKEDVGSIKAPPEKDISFGIRQV